MSFNENTQTVLTTADNVVTKINSLLDGIDSGDKQINDAGITDNVVEAWTQLEEKVDQVIEETEIAWLFTEEVTDTPEESDSNVEDTTTEVEVQDEE